jgi:hypothetical protein
MRLTSCPALHRWIYRWNELVKTTQPTTPLKTTQATQPGGTHFPLVHRRSLYSWEIESPQNVSTFYRKQPLGINATEIRTLEET